MAKARAKKSGTGRTAPKKSQAKAASGDEHVYCRSVRCITDARGYETHRNLSPTEIRVHETDGFIPLWAPGVTLRYRFRESSLTRYFKKDADAGREQLQDLFDAGLAEWGDAAPVRFTHNEDASDFEIVMMPTEDCDDDGCVLASAFFPDAGRHEFRVYPTALEQSDSEQVETFAHEIGHIFGLRHFFANISETRWPSHLFGEDKPFSIMNYGHESMMTDVDRADLNRLYQSVWSGELTEIDGAPIQMMRPFSSLAGRRSSGKIAASALAGEARNPVQIIVGGRKVTVE